MLNICLCGYYGKMGQSIIKCSHDFKDLRISIGIDKMIEKTVNDELLLFNNIKDVINKNFDVIIDFSNTNAIYDLYYVCISKKVPIVLCTTGYNIEQQNLIKKMSNIIPVFQSGNMSIGINIINNILKDNIKLLYNDFDIEIIEKHHNKKIDAPSGTALMLANTISENIPYKIQLQYDRNNKRSKNDIGMQSIRGGTIIGEHDIIFAGNDEIITISHTALSRNIFANGSLYAAKFLFSCKTPKIYNMNDLLIKK